MACTALLSAAKLAPIYKKGRAHSAEMFLPKMTKRAQP